MKCLSIGLIVLLGWSPVYGQDVFLSAYKKIPSGSNTAVDRISFSENALHIGVSDAKGGLYIFETESSNLLKKEPASGKIAFHDFLDTDQKFIAVKSNGEYLSFGLSTYEKTKVETFSAPYQVTLDPNQGYLTLVGKSNQIEVYDLKANMMQARIPAMGDVKNTLFMGFDRFGQQLATINNTGEAHSWEFLNQKFIRQLNLQSGEYTGSRSVIHAATTSKGSDHFVIGLQEVFIPKGGLQPGRQPERKNMLIAYDWTTGQEKKRVPLRYRPDGITFGPIPSTLIYFSSDSRTIFIVDLNKGEVRESVSVDERPSAIALSDNGELLAVGTVSGMVYLFEVIRNSPAEIRIINPSVNRNYGDEVVKSPSILVEGKVESQERISQVTLNGQPADINPDGTFRNTVTLVPGKNRVRVAAQSTQSNVITRDLYFNYEPAAKQAPSTNTNSSFTRRVALVIGNAEYASTGKLRNTVNDARSMSATLKELGFEVQVIEDGTYETIKNAIYAFGDRIQDVDVSMFFYAGHGLEVDGVNYLVPVDADIQSHLDIKQKCIPLTGVLYTMEFANAEGLNMIILDACRNNPFPAGKRGGAGLARVNAPSGTIIAYATDPGSVASDGDGVNGLYSGELIKQLRISQRIEDIFMNTRNNVEKVSGGKQRPWEEARLKGVFYLK